MNTSIYTIRNYRPADFAEYAQLHLETERLETTGHCPSPQTLNEQLHRPGYSAEQNLFIAETAGKTVGYMDITPELNVRRVILNCLIHPAHRKRGLASRLLDYTMHRAKELEVTAMRVNIVQNNVIAKKTLSRLGFKSSRRFLQLRLDMTKVNEPDINQSFLQCGHMKHGEESKLTQLQNVAFADAWEYNPNTVEEITYCINLSNCSPEDIILAYDGEKAIGYCWTKPGNQVNATNTEKNGQIFILGVHPDYRGTGTGRKVLLAGLSHIKSRGIQTTELTVDSSNKAAFSLYQSMGFTVHTSNLWYERLIS